MFACCCVCTPVIALRVCVLSIIPTSIPYLSITPFACDQDSCLLRLFVHVAGASSSLPWHCDLRCRCIQIAFLAMRADSLHLLIPVSLAFCTVLTVRAHVRVCGAGARMQRRRGCIHALLHLCSVILLHVCVSARSSRFDCASWLLCITAMSVGMRLIPVC